MSNPVSVIASMPNVSPELKFAAALIGDALDQAKAGDREAAVWLQNCSLSWIEWICPSDIALEAIHQALIAQLPHSLRSHAVCSLAMQAELFEMEAA